MAGAETKIWHISEIEFQRTIVLAGQNGDNPIFPMWPLIVDFQIFHFLTGNSKPK